MSSNHKPDMGYDLDRLLDYLVKLDCHPVVYRRGKNLWRAHVNVSGNFWAEGSTPVTAMRKAIKLWDSKDRPMDGAACPPTPPLSVMMREDSDERRPIRHG